MAAARPAVPSVVLLVASVSITKSEEMVADVVSVSLFELLVPSSFAVSGGVMLSVSVPVPVGKESIKQSMVWMVVPPLGLAVQAFATVKPVTTASVVIAEAEVKVKRTVVLGAGEPVLSTSR